MDITERFEYIVNQLFKGNKAQFAKTIGVAPTSISNYFSKSRRSKPSSEILESIVNNIPEINSTWLLTGKGEMLDKPEKNSMNISGSGIVANTGTAGRDITISSSTEVTVLRKRVKDLEAENEQLKQDKMILQDFVKMLKEKGNK